MGRGSSTAQRILTNTARRAARRRAARLGPAQLAAVLLVLVLVIAGIVWWNSSSQPSPGAESSDRAASADELPMAADDALENLEDLETASGSSETAYDREAFGATWPTLEEEDCDARNVVLARDLSAVELDDDECTVLSGVLDDPYTGEEVPFERGADTSTDVQIDHVVALSDAWHSGADEWDEKTRQDFANDPEVLLAVDGPANTAKSDSAADEWLPENDAYVCEFVIHQITIKDRYDLEVTTEERSAKEDVLATC